MNFFKKLFVKNPEDFLVKGDRLLQEGRFFEAKCVFEESLNLLNGKSGVQDEVHLSGCRSRITAANTGLATLNIREAEHLIALGATAKAAEHLELAVSLTEDPLVRKETARLFGTLDSLSRHSDTSNIAPPPTSGCNSCSSGARHAPAVPTSVEPDMEMSEADHFDLLIRQLPGELYHRYAALGDKFIPAYLAVSRDDHQQALIGLDDWFEGTDRDIYCYEKAMALYRLGEAAEAEHHLKEAIRENNANPLPHLGLSLLLVERERFPEAAIQLDSMIDGGILAEQAALLRGDVYVRTGDSEEAIHMYATLLTTPLARPAAENLYHLLLESDREADAAAIFKKYLKGCGGH